MRVLCFAAVLLWFQAAGFVANAADWSTIKIGTDGRFPPWNATNSNGDLVGFRNRSRQKSLQAAGGQV